LEVHPHASPLELSYETSVISENGESESGWNEVNAYITKFKEVAQEIVDENVLTVNAYINSKIEEEQKSRKQLKQEFLQLLEWKVDVDIGLGKFINEYIPLSKIHSQKINEFEQKLTDFIQSQKIQNKKEFSDINWEIDKLVELSLKSKRNINDNFELCNQFQSAVKKHLNDEEFNQLFVKEEEKEFDPLSFWKLEPDTPDSPARKVDKKVEILSKCRPIALKDPKMRVLSPCTRKGLSALSPVKSSKWMKNLLARPRNSYFNAVTQSFVSPGNLPFGVQGSRGWSRTKLPSHHL